jgi:hypothetical protein
MALPDAQAAASEVFSAAFLNGHSVFKLRSIGDNRSTIPAAAAFHGRAIVPNGSARRTSGGVFGFLGYGNVLKDLLQSQGQS